MSRWLTSRVGHSVGGERAYVLYREVAYVWDADVFSLRSTLDWGCVILKGKNKGVSIPPMAPFPTKRIQTFRSWGFPITSGAIYRFRETGIMDQLWQHRENGHLTPGCRVKSPYTSTSGICHFDLDTWSTCPSLVRQGHLLGKMLPVHPVHPLVMGSVSGGMGAWHLLSAPPWKWSSAHASTPFTEREYC